MHKRWVFHIYLSLEEGIMFLRSLVYIPNCSAATVASLDPATMCHQYLSIFARSFEQKGGSTFEPLALILPLGCEVTQLRARLQVKVYIAISHPARWA